MNEPQPACYTAESILRDGYLMAVRFDAPIETQDNLANAHKGIVYSNKPKASIAAQPDLL
jgi:hypothetical protein